MRTEGSVIWLAPDQCRIGSVVIRMPEVTFMDLNYPSARNSPSNVCKWDTDQLPSGFCVIFPSFSMLPVMPVQALPWHGTAKFFSWTPSSVVMFHIDPVSPQPVSVRMITVPVGMVYLEENCRADVEHSEG